MRVAIDDVKWCTYDKWEGPMYVGHHAYDVVAGAPVREKFLKVVTSAEGGHFDAVNMYDRAVVSTGLIQWAEGTQFATSRMLGKVAVTCGATTVVTPLLPAMHMCNAEFKQTSSGKWRFHVAGSEITTLSGQQLLFLGCDGLKGSWSEDSKTYAKTWAAAFASIWDDERARTAQVAVATSDLINYAINESRQIMFGDVVEVRSNDLPGALRAIYLMYGINRPSTANEMLLRATALTQSAKWSKEWCKDVLACLVCGPKIKIYPARYTAVKGITERLFNVELPTLEDIKTRSSDIEGLLERLSKKDE